MWEQSMPQLSAVRMPTSISIVSWVLVKAFFFSGLIHMVGGLHAPIRGSV